VSCRLAQHTGRARRKGAVIIIVLFLLTIVGVVVGTLVHALLIEHRQLHVHHQQLQAAWLAESGLQRAVARLRTDGEFSGETWSLPAEALGSDADGSVEIRVAPVEGRPHWRRVAATADYPNDPQHRKRCSREVLVNLGTNHE
jgi:hypothetical protein